MPPQPAPAASAGAAAPDQEPPPSPPPSRPPPPPPRPAPSLASALPFWFYLTAAVSLLALLLPHLLPSSPPPLPPLLRSHTSEGSVLKLHPGPDLFAVTSRPAAAAGHPAVLILPGLAAGSFSFRRLLPSLSSRGLLAAAVDLPGQGMSPAPAAPPRANPFREIMNRGVFHAFEHLVQTGEVPFQEPAAPDPSHALYAPAEAAASVARAVDALGLAAAPVHLVLHDSALVAGAAFVSAHPGAVQSVTLIDTTAVLPAFPAAVLGVPVLGSLVVRVPALFKGLLRLCCAREMGAEEAEAHRAAMRIDGKRDAVFESWKALNQSFDLKEWRGSSEAVRKLPMMVLWSGSWTDRWIDEGKMVVAALPDAKFVYHSGGRWPQEDAYDELSKLIAEFVTSLPPMRSQYIDQSSEEATAQE
ncbi:protein AUXIN RESPONSE 4 [Oryza brachyantha]|nr:protein AUXIN RESPONSE 4 [Oryza brachyantha]